MKLLHTADWHLGRQFEGLSLEADHAAILDQVFAAIVAHRPDALVIAGDLFDRALPPETAVRQFNGFLARVASQTSTAIVLIAGNHDSGERIGAMATLSDGRRALVRGPLNADEPALVLHDAHGPVAFSALPFGYEFAAREAFGDPAIACPADVMAAQVAAARRHVPAGARWVVVAHAFVSGGSESGVERPLSKLVGGIETVPASVFAGAHYVALGHLHRPQAVGAAHIRYSGAPLAFSFDEEEGAKSMSLVEIGADGAVVIETIPFTPLRGVRTLNGTLAELLALPGSEDFVRPVLADKVRLIEPMKRIRERFPNACALMYARDGLASTRTAEGVAAQRNADPKEVVGAFLALVRDGEATKPEEEALIAEHLGAMTAAAGAGR